MKKAILVGFGVLFVFGIILGGCGGSEEAAVEEPAVEAETATPEPATALGEAAQVMEEAAAAGDQVEAPAGRGPAWISDAENMPAAFIAAEDGDGDGKVAKDEFKGPDTLFDQLDKNQDGIIELSEGPTPDMVEEMGLGGGGARSGEGAPQYEATSPHVGDGPTGQAFIDMLDADKDGKVTHDEWEGNKNESAYKSKHWPEYNQNGDEYITLDEAPQEGVNWEEEPVEEEEAPAE